MNGASVVDVAVSSRCERRSLSPAALAAERGAGVMKGWHVTGKVAPRNRLSLRCARAGYCCSIAALLVLCGSNNLQNAIAQGETRTISFHHIHTDEELTVTYKVNGRYDEEALRKINNLLRDWRESKSIAMDPHLIDLLWEVHREVGAKEAGKMCVEGKEYVVKDGDVLLFRFNV